MAIGGVLFALSEKAINSSTTTIVTNEPASRVTMGSLFCELYDVFFGIMMGTSYRGLALGVAILMQDTKGSDGIYLHPLKHSKAITIFQRINRRLKIQSACSRQGTYLYALPAAHSMRRVTAIR